MPIHATDSVKHERAQSPLDSGNTTPTTPTPTQSPKKPKIKSSKETAPASLPTPSPSPTKSTKSTNPIPTEKGTSQREGQGTGRGTPGAKARFPTEAKWLIGEEIVERGIAGLDVDGLVRATGMSKQQIAWQLIQNRQNLRKQMMDAVRSLQ